MRRPAVLLAVLTVAWLGAAPAAALQLGAPAPLPELQMADVDGARWSLAEVKGEKGTLVLFLAVHCPWVQQWSGRIAALAEQASDAGIGVLGVNSNDPERVPQDGIEGMRRQIAEAEFRFPYVVDRGSRLARAFGARRTPEAYLFDATGALAYRGTIDDDAHDADAVERHFLRDAIRAVARGAEPDPAETKALGCTLKEYSH